MKISSFKKIIYAIMAITIGIVNYGCSKDRGTRIVVKGSTTVLPITQKTAEEYRMIHRVSISIEGSGSGNGIRALIDGACDIANSSREIKGEEIKKAKEKGINIREIAVAFDMIIPIVHPTNQIKDITMNQLKAIYGQTITNWKELGGKNQKIVVISRDTSSGTYEVWHNKVMNKTDVGKGVLLQASNGAIITAVAVNPKAIGYIGYGYLNNTVKALTVNKIKGIIKNGKSGKFPIARRLYMYVNKDKLTKEAESYINFILSKKGQNFVKKTGFIPL